MANLFSPDNQWDGHLTGSVDAFVGYLSQAIAAKSSGNLKEADRLCDVLAQSVRWFRASGEIVLARRASRLLVALENAWEP